MANVTKPCNNPRTSSAVGTTLGSFSCPNEKIIPTLDVEYMSADKSDDLVSMLELIKT